MHVNVQQICQQLLIGRGNLSLGIRDTGHPVLRHDILGQGMSCTDQ